MSGVIFIGSFDSCSTFPVSQDFPIACFMLITCCKHRSGISAAEMMALSCAQSAGDFEILMLGFIINLEYDMIAENGGL